MSRSKVPFKGGGRCKRPNSKKNEERVEKEYQWQMDSSGSSIGGKSGSSRSSSKVPLKGEKRCKRPNGKSGQLVDLSQHDSLLCTGIYKFPLAQIPRLLVLKRNFTFYRNLTRYFTKSRLHNFYALFYKCIRSNDWKRSFAGPTV